MAIDDIEYPSVLPAFAPRFGKVCILGLGKTGEAVAQFCFLALAQDNPVVESLTIYGGAGNDKTLAAAKPFIQAGFEVFFDTEEVCGSFDTCVVSPGISQNSAFYHSAAAASQDIMTEPEFAYLLSPKNWIAITGTNGKTTTTALTAHLMREAGFSARAVGNIGDPCITAVCDRREGEYLVAELSSYQLASTKRFSPRVAVLLNITPDHLAWHGSHEAYIAAKMKIFDNLDFDALAIVDVADPEAAVCAGILSERGTRVLGVDTQAWEVVSDGAGLVDGVLKVSIQGMGVFELCTVDELAIKGEHNVTNALAAASAALYCGAASACVTRGLKTFKPLEHRIEPCGCVDGVEYFNDSKATNTDAVLKALTAFGDKPLIVLLGGKDKGTDLAELVQACNSRCKAVVCYGQARERFLAAFDGCEIDVLAASGMIEAAGIAGNIAQAGEVVLLSPACASFDEFDSFEQRGDVFKEFIAHLPGERE